MEPPDLGIDDAAATAWSVTVLREEGVVVVAEPLSGIAGVGPTLPDAAADFDAALVEYRDTLLEAGSISPQLERLLTWLMSVKPLTA